jgi:hypothetical protein
MVTQLKATQDGALSGGTCCHKADATKKPNPLKLQCRQVFFYFYTVFCELDTATEGLGQILYKIICGKPLVQNPPSHPFSDGFSLHFSALCK